MNHKLILAIVIFCSGCSSTFTTRPYNGAEDAKGIKNGITYYETRLAIVHYVFTKRTEKDGSVTGVLNDKDRPCEKMTQKDDIQFLPDISRKMVIFNEPSTFSASQFQLGFNNNGTLAGINTTNTPQTSSLFSTLETAAKDKVLFITKAGQILACNDSPIIESIRFISNLDELVPSKQ